MSKLKIVTFSHYGELYGANRSLLGLLMGTREEIEWWVICRKPGDFTNELKKNKIKFTIVPFWNDVYNGPRKLPLISGTIKFLQNVLKARKVGKLISNKGFDIIHTNSSVTFIGALVSLLYKKKHIWHLREFVYEDYDAKYYLGRKAFDYFAEKADLLVCISRSIQQKRVIQRSISAPSLILYNGLDGARNLVERTSPVHKIPVLAVVGVLNEAKNQLTAIKAVNILLKKGVTVKLRLVGDAENSPDYNTQVNQYIAEEGISEYVEFAGFQSDISAIFRETDMLIMCSENEAFGRVTVESMMHGVPVVAYAGAGTEEIVTDQISGLLYRGNETQLAERIQRLLSDQELYASISKNALKHATENFSISNYTTGFVRLAKNVAIGNNLNK